MSEERGSDRTPFVVWAIAVILWIVLSSITGCSADLPTAPEEPLPAAERLQRQFDLLEQDIRQAWRDGEPVEIWMTIFPDSIPRFTVRPIAR